VSRAGARTRLRALAVPAALAVLLLGAPAAHAHSEQEELAEEAYAKKHPAKAAVTPVGSDSLRLAA
jgi:hypothetical protein